MTQVNHPWQLKTRPGWGIPLGLVPDSPSVPNLAQVNRSAVPRRRRFIRTLVVSDASIIAATVLTVGVLILGPKVSAALFAVMVSTTWLVGLSCFQTRARYRIANGFDEYKRVMIATAVSIGISAFVAMLISSEQLRAMILIAYPSGLALLLLERWTWRHWLHQQGHAISNVVVAGRGPDIDHVLRQLNKHASPAYNVVGVVNEADGNPAVGRGGTPSFVGMQNLGSIAQSVQADAVIVASELDGGSQSLREIVWRLEESNMQVVIVPSLSNVVGRRMKVRSLEGMTMVHVETPRFSHGANLVKRIMDILISAVSLLVLLPVFAFLAIMIRRDSRGPVLFSQERVGLKGETFKMHKFRSMVVNAEEELRGLQESNEGSGLLFKMRNDPRITKVGVWMRKFSLDELPQLLNVLRGEMSLVGPRPPLPAEVADYTDSTHRRLYIRPGLTGLWQVSGRSDLSWEESIRLDLHYVENWSLSWDLLIVWKTFKVVIHPVGAY